MASFLSTQNCQFRVFDSWRQLLFSFLERNLIFHFPHILNCVIQVFTALFQVLLTSKSFSAFLKAQRLPFLSGAQIWFLDRKISPLSNFHLKPIPPIIWDDKKSWGTHFFSFSSLSCFSHFQVAEEYFQNTSSTLPQTTPQQIFTT